MRRWIGTLLLGVAAACAGDPVAGSDATGVDVPSGPPDVAADVFSTPDIPPDVPPAPDVSVEPDVPATPDVAGLPDVQEQPDSATDPGAPDSPDVAPDAGAGVCEPVACQELVGTGEEASSCEYAPDPTQDGETCQSDALDPCGSGFACNGGRCDLASQPCTDFRPVVFVHGVNGSSANYATMIARLEADGWPPESLHAFDAVDPEWGCNVDNAAAIKQLVDGILASTCRNRIDLVAHSMGTLSSRYYMKNLGGHEVVNTYVTLGGMHHGLASPCWSPDFVRDMVCVWKEICESNEFVAQLNEDPAMPGQGNWVSIYGTADTSVPNESSYVEGAENIELPDVEHDGANGLLEVVEAYEEVKRVLHYPCW